MAVSRMKKMQAAVLKKDAAALVRRLMWHSCAAIETEAGLPAPAGEYAEELAESIRRKEKIGEALKLLKEYRPAKKGLFRLRRAMTLDDFEGTDPSKALECAAESEGYGRRLQEIEAQKRLIAAERTSLGPWLGCDAPVTEVRTPHTVMFYGILPGGQEADALTAELAETVPDAYAEKIPSDTDEEGGDSCLCVVCHRESEAETLGFLSRRGFLRAELGGELPAARTAALEREDLALDEEKERIGEKLTELSASCDLLETAYDRVATDVTALEALMQTVATESAVILTGWVPQKAEKAAANELEKAGAYYTLSEPEEGDDPPVLLDNKPLFTPFESVISLYSLPAYGSFDPTAIMSVFYFILFGLMLGDVIYGLLLTFGCLFLLKKADLGRGVKNLVRMFCICGVSCSISGLLFGSWCGDLPSVFMSMFGVDIGDISIAFDMVKEPINFLIVAFAVGAAHLLAGMGVKFYLLCREGKVFDAVFDIGSWYVLFAGLGILVFNRTVGGIVAGVGALMLIATQGREAKNPVMRFLKGLYSLYGIINYVSDLLSYSRIMALGLATAVIASVINILATLMGPTIAGFILMPGILIVGHVVNLVINLLGTFVHTSRLQYIEFFGKFYEDGGRAFRPVAPELTYTDPTLDPGK